MTNGQFKQRVIEILNKRRWEHWATEMRPDEKVVTELSHDEKVVISWAGMGRGTRIIVAVAETPDEGMLLEVAQEIIAGDAEPWGLDDLDPVTWQVQVGNSFHGTPDDPQLLAVADNLGLARNTDFHGFDEMWGWVIVQCTDWAS